MIRERTTRAGIAWIATTRLTQADQQQLKQQYGLSDEMLVYVTDPDERANYTDSEETGEQLIITHAPRRLQQQTGVRYVSEPIGFLIKNQQVFTFNQQELPDIEFLLTRCGADETLETPVAFCLTAIKNLIDQYLPVLKYVTKERNRLDKLLNQSRANRDLVALSYLQQTLTFLISATQNNLELLTHLDKTVLGVASVGEEELLEDALIEAQQISEMTSLETEVVDRVAQTFDSLVNNDLNHTMGFLTVWSLALTVPTIITGFYGMNVGLPLSRSRWTWILIVLLSVVIIGSLIYEFRKRGKF
jgi:Mg2+ and Co2+ transporter CorA